MNIIQRVKRLIRLAKAASSDERLPKYLRWIFRVSLAIKAIPGPDFGIDEVGLLIGAILLQTLYRETWTQIRSEIQ